VDLDFGARPFAEQNAVANLDVDGDELPILVAAAGADGDDLTLGGFFLGGVGDDDATCRLILGIDALNDDAVVERTKLHGVSYAMGNEDWMERDPGITPGGVPPGTLFSTPWIGLPRRDTNAQVLSSFSDLELADMGINRCDIDRIARGQSR